MRFALSSPLLLILIPMVFSCSTLMKNQDEEILSIMSTFSSTNLSPEEFAYSELIKSGIKPEFADRLKKHYVSSHLKPDQRDRIIELNVLGFLNPGDYSAHYSETSVHQIRKFLKKYAKTLNLAEKKYQVSKEVVASLLWVETKHGKFVGHYNLPAVYFALAQASHPEVAKSVLTELNFRKPSSQSSASKLTYPELHQKVAQRLNAKSKWALEQLRSIESIQSKHALPIFKTPSSFAGAFGCSQFIPSSYEQFAASAYHVKPNLFDMRDCIFSVANFLKVHGWNSENPRSHNDALFEYNRIRDYGDVILKLAQQTRE